ncbi:oxidoreductase, partial [Pseudoalteromonas sp. S1649]
FPVAQMALEHGCHVLSDNPAPLTLAEARQLQSIISKQKRLYGLSPTSTG